MKSNQIEVYQVNNMSYNMHRQNDEVEKLCGNVVLSIDKMMKQLPLPNEKCSIHRVPKLLREMNSTAYTPHVISIGPLHHLREDLIATKQYKFLHFTNFLRRLDTNMSSLEFLVKTTQTWMEEARNCYAEPINMSDEDFVKMMLIDGCFIVEFLIIYYYQCHPHKLSQTHNNLDLSLYQRSHEMWIDFMMLENQVPFFVLQGLFDLIPQYDVPTTFIQLTCDFVHLGLPEDYHLLNVSLEKPKHFVNILGLYFVFPKMPLDVNNDKSGRIMPPSITELYEAGVTIKKAEHAKCMMKISFENGILTIPLIVIDDFFETMMRNLIAFEHFPLDSKSKCIQYVSFMDDLISTEKDVNILVKKGIIINDIGGSDIEVSKLFNNLCKFVELPHVDCFKETSTALREHCNRRWNKAKASLKHNYFNTPWAIVSFIAATLLIVLTLIQTIFSTITAFSSK